MIDLTEAIEQAAETLWVIVSEGEPWAQASDEDRADCMTAATSTVTAAFPAIQRAVSADLAVFDKNTIDALRVALEETTAELKQYREAK